MTASTLISVTPKQLDDLMQTHHVGDYLLIDVRQPGEYEAGHIPGAKLIPLMRLVADLHELPRDRDLIFYCRSDARSMAAATLALEEQIFSGQIYHLSGGIMAYTGKIQPQKPRLKLFQSYTGLSDQLQLAMEMEKGALKFYEYLADQLDPEPCAQVFRTLSQAEIKHLKSIFNFRTRQHGMEENFETYFEKLQGEILEGGDTYLQLKKRFADTKQNVCIAALELALDVEYRAFDLYRNLAESFKEKPVQQLFWDLSQAEKAHIKQLSQVTI